MPESLRMLPVLLVLAVSAGCIWLGLWQLERMTWKRELLARARAGMLAEPVPLPPNAGIDPDRLAFRTVRLAGRYHHEHEFLFPAPLGHGYGYRVVTPLERPDGSLILVDRGWIPEEKRAQGTRMESRTPGKVSLTGRLRRLREGNRFTPGNEPDDNLWFREDPAQLSARAGATLPPVMIEAIPGEVGPPAGRQAPLAIPDNHLAYALTWFGLAVAAPVIYLLRRRRSG